MQIENLTPTLERTLKLAEIEASKDKSFVSLQHVLIGMMLEGENYASLNLAAAGFTVEGLRKLKAINPAAPLTAPEKYPPALPHPDR